MKFLLGNRICLQYQFMHSRLTEINCFIQIQYYFIVQVENTKCLVEIFGTVLFQHNEITTKYSKQCNWLLQLEVSQKTNSFCNK